MALREMLLLFGMDVSKDDENRVKGAVDRVKQAAQVLAGVWATIKVGDVINEIVMDTAELGDEINRTSEKLGVGTDALQELYFAAEQVSVSQEDLGTSFRVLGKQASAAAEGSKGALDSFKDLGITLEDLKNGDGSLKTTDQLLRLVADGMGSVSDPTKKAAIASELLGRSGANLIPMLKDGSAGLDEMAASAHELGYVLNAETLKAAGEMDDASDYLNAALKGLKNTLGAELLPTFTEGVKVLGRLAKAAVPIVKIFAKILLDAFKLMGSLVKGVNIAFGQLTKTFGFFGNVIGGLSVALTALGASFAIAGQAATVAGLKAAGAWVIATAPVLLMIAAIGLIGLALFLLVDEFVTMGEGGETIIGDLITYFTDLVDEVGGVGNAIKEVFFNSFEAIFGMSRETFDGIVDAIDWILEPTRMVVETITNLFATLMNFITEVFTGNIKDAFSGLWRDVLETAQQFAGHIERITGGVTSLLGLGGSSSSASAGMAGDSASSMAASPALAAAGGKTIVNSPNTKVEIHVDASGNSNPNAVGHAVGSSVDGVIERQNRDVLDAFSVGAG